MSFNSFLIQIVLISCGALLFQAKRIAPGMVAIAALNLLILGLSYLLVPQVAGWISGGYWAIALLWPSLVLIRLNRLIQREQYEGAVQLARRWHRLQFIGGYLQCPDLLQGLALAQRGEGEAALALIEPYRRKPGAMGQNANILYYRFTCRWPEFLAWVQQHFSEQALFSSPSSLGMTYVRAFGEVGNLDKLVSSFDRFRRSGDLHRDRNSFNSLRMMLLAFCGRPVPVQHLFRQQLASAPSETQRYWLGTATLAAGDIQAGTAQLQALRQVSNAMFQQAIDYRLAQVAQPRAAPLSPEMCQILDQIEREVLGEVSLNDPQPQRRWPSATWVLIGLNLLVFASQYGAIGLSAFLDQIYNFNGSYDVVAVANLLIVYATGVVRYGPLVPAEVLAGQWWRLISAVFLHAGLVHIAANMLGLFYYGNFVEAKLGTPKFLLIYTLTGIGSMVGMMVVA
ncbi:MAG: rhomboid family intramembrane serine protease [Synechococcales cyanobacterium RM1_1_8]|nr:rhomboid family intramembrane serine protease [Synechococcales cyanobacterium RM1_1_8]